jgi:hypothetical protein
MSKIYVQKLHPFVGRLGLDWWQLREIWVRLLVRRGFDAVDSATLLQGLIGGQLSLVSVLSRVENAL